MKAYTKEHPFDEFTAAKEQFDYVVGELQSESCETLEHGDVETLIEREGREILRRLMQGYLDRRSHREERRPV
ncbi:MAG: ISKra4 family transposase, partial [Gammaproteobacteria bacterium]|nr:ISKra4 family transposase [Gammaproteobacteria bacterium]